MKRAKQIGGILVDAQQPWRTENLGRLLLNAFSLFEAKVIEALHREGFAFTRQVHLKVMRHVDREGTRMSELSKRLGITNGAATQAVELCIKEELVEVSADSDDKRVRRVRFTKKGKRFLDTVHSQWDAIESDLQKTLGAHRLTCMRQSLLTIEEKP